MDEPQVIINGLWLNYGESVPFSPTGLQQQPMDLSLSMRVTYPDGATADVSAPLTSDEVEAVMRLLTRYSQRIVAAL